MYQDGQKSQAVYILDMYLQFSLTAATPVCQGDYASKPDANNLIIAACDF